MFSVRYSRLLSGFLSACSLSVTLPVAAEVATNAMSAEEGKHRKLIRVAADPWCPYNCEPEQERQGLMIDIAAAALKLSGYALDYQIINWARAKKMVIHGQLDGIVGMSRESKTETLYHFSNTPLGWSQICFFKRADDAWSYQSTHSLEDRIMGWINDYGFTNPDIDQWVKAKRKTPAIAIVSGVRVHNSLFKMLLAKRIDTFAEDLYVVQNLLNEDQLQGVIRVAGCAPEKDEVHIAFTKTSEARHLWSKALDDGVQRLRDSGELASILARYNLTPDQWAR